MSKILAFSDLHLKGKNSTYRLGKYKEDILLKVDEILSLAKKYKVEYILDNGDILENESPSYSIIDALADRVESAKIPLYSLLGNHCMLYANIENSKGTALTHLIKRSKYFNYLDKIEGDDYVIKGYEYRTNIEKEIKEKGLFFDETDKWKIGIVHALVMEKPFFKDVSHVVCKDIKTNFDLLLLSHYHHPFRVKTKTTEFLNIGCCGRLNINEHNVEPSVILLDTEKRDYKIIKLTCAKKGEEVFDLTKYNELKENKKDIKEFIASLNSVNFQSLNITEQIFNICEEKDIKDYLTLKMEEVKNGKCK